MEVYATLHSYVIPPDETGYGVIRARIAPGEYVIFEPRHCSVPLGLTRGTPMLFEGEYNERRTLSFPFNGEPCFRFTSAVQTMPKDEASAIEYISNMQIRGIAAANAKHIVDVTGPDFESYFFKYPDAEDFAMKIPSLRVHSAEAFIRRIMTSTTQKHMLDFMFPLGAGYESVFKMYKDLTQVYNRELTIDEVWDALKPHKFTAEGELPNGCYYYGAKADILFDSVDLIAQELGYRAYHPERVRSLTYQALLNIEESGHIWSSLDDVYKECRKITMRSAFPDEVISRWAIYAAIKTTPWLMSDEDNGSRIYLESSRIDEREVVKHVRRIQRTGKVLPYNKQIIDDIEVERNIEFSQAQRDCFEFLEYSGIRIVTGGAGTGKTTTISGLLTAYTRLNPDGKVALCAPTGRAAQRMTELCSSYGANVRAYTIHKLLEFMPFDGETKPNFNEVNPLDADMLIVDEMSMVDLHLFALLVKAIKDGALVILCGDVNQLPSVAAGRVFGDLIESRQFDVVRLTTNYRQAQGTNNIIPNANKINDGNCDLQCGPDFSIIECHSDDEMKSAVVDLIMKDTNQTVLTTIRRNSAGVYALNQALQPIINATPGNSIKMGQVTFHENDQIIMTHNNYEAGYVNGDVGVIDKISNGDIHVDFGGEIKIIEHKNFKDMMLAYAMTIHKSQGSEYPSVIVVLPNSAPHMLARNLLYTAVTRAKRKVTIISEPGAIERAVQNTRNTVRRTTLKELLNI